jgi:hypothetical protein
MDKIEMLGRLVSIKNNALERARQESQGNPYRELEIKAYILQHGIEQLMIEIQNTMSSDNRISSAIPACQINITFDPDKDTSCTWPRPARRTG